MNAKRIVVAIALICVLCMAGAAQAKTTDAPIITIENGFALGYNVSSSNIGSAFDLTIGLGVADKLQFAFSVVSGNDTTFGTYKLLSLNYSLAPKIGVSTIVGYKSSVTADIVAGLGLYMNVLQRDMGDLSTAFKLKIDYITPLSNYAGGVVGVDLVASIGI